MWRHLEVELSSWIWRWTSNMFLEHTTKFHEVYVKHGHLVDCIRLDPAEIRSLVRQTPLAVSAWVGEASTGAFVLAVFAFNCRNKEFPLQQSMVLFWNWIWQRHSAHGVGLRVGWPVREGKWRNSVCSCRKCNKTTHSMVRRGQMRLPL